ncbi:hypothetical protein BABINDRAFT_163820 [Babjeviella inositovora NRRL Y-12698]|uniref:Uncharacterized protein n=1 Tax=Babjeviella inositovora NRRL Y-12698 TaxID=984486 RepID=A0A1E3QHA9_9ASCO|nr:uncharacterized protein BABINDRAFT_163820 [Babjeviella inositovora NRRL Y-12698]ODQ77085.1 hypothetical protein BABINDRAFT_163820 [Babjeviella inositovora NRRL Y-12698]
MLYKSIFSSKLLLAFRAGATRRCQSTLPKCPHDTSKISEQDFYNELTLSGGYGKPLFMSYVTESNPYEHPLEPSANPRPTEMPEELDLCDLKHLDYYPPGSYVKDVLDQLPPLPGFFNNKRITPWEIAPCLDIWPQHQAFEAIPRQVTYRLIYGSTIIETDKPELAFLNMVDRASKKVTQRPSTDEDSLALVEVMNIKQYLEGLIRKSGNLLFVAPASAIKLPKSRFYLKKTYIDQKMMERTLKYAIMKHLLEHMKMIDVFMKGTAESIRAETRKRVSTSVDRLLLQGFGQVTRKMHCYNTNEVLHKEEPHCIIIRKLIKKASVPGADAGSVSESSPPCSVGTLVWNSRSAYSSYCKLKKATVVTNPRSYARHMHRYERRVYEGKEKSPSAIKQYSFKLSARQFMRLSIVEGGSVQYRH